MIITVNSSYKFLLININKQCNKPYLYLFLYLQVLINIF